VLFSSHILSDVEDVADRIGILHGGKIATSGSIRDLMTSFGLPTEIEVEYSVAPTKLPFEGTPKKPNEWRIVVKDGEDMDTVIHDIVRNSLEAGGKLRRIGLVEPDLDDLFAQYINTNGGARG